MRIVITGGAGFIGSHVVDAFIGRGDEVLVIDDFSSGREANLESAKQAAPSALSLCRADICGQEAADAIIKFSPELIIHHAAQINVRRSVTEPAFDTEKNVVGTVSLLHAAQAAGTKSFILASTGGAIYGEQEQNPAPEDHPVRPECPYGVSKRAAELYIEYFARTFSMTGIALRYANVYGPRQNAKGEAGVVAIFCDLLNGWRDLAINGDGEQTRDFVYVGDVVQANLLASQIDAPGEFKVFNVGTGHETSINDLTNTLVAEWRSSLAEEGQDIDVAINHREAVAGEQRISCVDPSLIQRELGWKPTVDLKTGLANTVAYARAIKF
jgi:UDP-glucose 4-epimerase